MKNFNNKIIILDDVLTESECQFLIDFYNTCGHTHKWYDTFPMTLKEYYQDVSVSKLKDENIREHVFKIKDSINNLFSEKLDIDWCEIVKWPDSSSKGEHFDSGLDRTVFTSVTYLNDDYNGGETFFTNDLKVTPKKGRTLYFDGNFYKHGVNTVKGRDRYTLPIWYKSKNNI